MYNVASGDIKILHGKPALIIGKTLVVSDLHIGIEKELWKEGIRVSGVSDRVIKELREILDTVRPKRIILNGDVKHNIPVFTEREKKQVKELVEISETYGKVIIVKGNHDGEIEKIVDVEVAPFVKEKNFYITHGHMRFDRRPVIIGHVHPAFPIPFPFKKELTKVWLISEDIIVLPAFSPFITGNNVEDRENLLGPVAKTADKYKVLTLDGYVVDEI